MATLPWARGAYLHDPPSAANMAGYDAWVGTNGTQVISCFGSRDSENSLEHPNYLIDPITAAGKTVCISFQGILSTGGEDWRSISRATLQARAKAFGDNLVAHGQPNAIIRMRTEADNGSAGDSPANAWAPSDIASYATCIQAIYTGLHSAAGNHFVCLADVAYDPGNNTPKIELLRAVLQWCDGFGLDSYNSAAPWGQAWSNEQTQWNNRWFGVNGGYGYKAYLDFALANNKPIGIPEFGEGWFYDNGGTAQEPLDGGSTYMTNMFNALMTHGVKVLFVNYWEDDNGLYLTGGHAQPKTTAAFKAGFGSLPGNSWPLNAAPATAPNAPVIGTAVAGIGQVSVAFTPASAGGTASSYVATLSNGQSATGTSSPIIVNSPAGTAVTATVKAVNSIGSSAASAVSNSVTPNTIPQAVLSLRAANGATSQLKINIPTITAAPPKNAVTGLTAVAIGNGQVTVSWTNPTPQPSSITIARDGVEATGGSPNWSGSIDGSSTSVTFNNLAKSTVYTFTITPAGGIATSVKCTTSAS